MIAGEAGIGKTRLLVSARERAESSGAAVLFATADESDGAVPLAAARALLGRAARAVEFDGPASLGIRALSGALAEPSGPGSRADEVVHALWWLLVELSDRGPLLVALDDAHWADELTIRLLRLTARRASELPLALVVAARPTAPGGAHAMLTAERAFVRLEPAPLSAAGTGRLVAEALGRVDDLNMVSRLRALTRGNPLYLRELLDDLRDGGRDATATKPPGDDVPTQLVALVTDRLEGLPSAAAELARALAALGGDATPARARRLADLQPTAALGAEEVLRAERILDVDRYGFVHPIVVAAVRDGLGAVRAAQLHGRAARLLAAEGVDDSRVAEHLMHTTAAGDPFVVATLRRAADSARRIGAYPAAARLLTRAGEEPPPAELADTVRFELGRCLVDAGVEDGQRILTGLLGDTPDASMRARCASILAVRIGMAGRHEHASRVLRDVLNGLDESDRELRPRLVAELAGAAGAVPSGLSEAASLIAAERARCTGQTAGERLLLAAATRMFSAQARETSAAAASARELLEQRLQRDPLIGFAGGSLIVWAIGVLISADALDDAERAMHVVREDAEQLANPGLVTLALLAQSQIAYQRGDLGRCELEARAAIEVGGDLARPLAAPWQVMCMADQNRHREAEETLAEAHLLGPVPASILFTAVLGGRGRLRLAQLDLERAIEDLAAVVERNTARGQRGLEPAWRPFLVQALALADRTAEAREQVRAYRAIAEEWRSRRSHAHAARLTALISPRPTAITHLELACTSFAASHARLELARALVELGAHRRAAGDRRQARAILRDGHDHAYACRATGLCDRARAELLLAGGRPRPKASAGPDALTPAERRVAELATQGQTNREIARRLYLSPKTVEMHLRSSYRKLDITRRNELPPALARQDRDATRDPHHNIRA